MLDSLITSKTRIKLLLKFFLNPETEAYLRELAKEFGESTNSIRIELNRLSAAKLLKSENSGRTILYRANVNHTMFQDLQTVVKKYVGLDRLVNNVVEKLGKVDQAFITGDYAKGNDTGIIDLVIIGDIDDAELLRLTRKTERLIGRKIRSLVITKKESMMLKKGLSLDNAFLIWDNTVNDCS